MPSLRSPENPFVGGNCGSHLNVALGNPHYVSGWWFLFFVDSLSPRMRPRVGRYLDLWLVVSECEST